MDLDTEQVSQPNIGQLSLGKILLPTLDSKNSKRCEERLGRLDLKPKTVKTVIVKKKTAALLEEMKSSSGLSSSLKSSLSIS